MNHMHKNPCCESSCQCCKPDVLSIAITALNNITAHADNEKIHLSEEEREWLDKAMSGESNNNGGSANGCDCAEALKNYYTALQIDKLLGLENGYITNIHTKYATTDWVSLLMKQYGNLDDYALKTYVASSIAALKSDVDDKFVLKSDLNKYGKTTVEVTPLYNGGPQNSTAIASIKVDNTPVIIYAPKAVEYTPGPDLEPIVIDPVKEKVSVIWCASNEEPTVPANATYDFQVNQYVNLGNWSVFKPETDKNIWFATGTFYSDGTFTGWSGPYYYVTPEDLIQTIPTYNHYFAEVYVASVTQPAVPIGANLFNFSSHALTKAPTDWYTTIEEAQRKATGGAKQLWVSRNYYSVNKDNTLETSESGWTNPVKWYNIDALLTEAKQTAQTLSANALISAKDAIDQAEALLQGGIESLREQLGVDINGIDDRIEVIEGSLDEGYFTKVEAAASGIAKLYEWIQVDDAPTNVDYALEFTLDEANGNPVDWLNTNHKGVDYFDKYAKLLPYGTVYKYVIGSLGIINLVAQSILTLDGEITEINTGLEELKADSWKLQIVNYALENADIQTAMMNIVKNRISLVVTNSNDNSAVFNLSIVDNVSNAEITADNIVLNGDVIAAAIRTKELNINNTTYLEGSGNVTFAASSSYVSKFNNDGTGNIAGDFIKWGTQDNGKFALLVKGIIDAIGGKIGGWTIADGYLFAEKNNCRIAIHPEQIYATNANNIPVWALKRDGSGSLANGTITWDANGRLFMSAAYILNDLKSQKVVVGNGTSTFNADGSGFVANGNIAWDASGNITLKNYSSESENYTIIDSAKYTITKGGVYVVTTSGTVSKVVEINVKAPIINKSNGLQKVTIIDGRANTTGEFMDSISYTHDATSNSSWEGQWMSAGNGISKSLIKVDTIFKEIVDNDLTNARYIKINCLDSTNKIIATKCVYGYQGMPLNGQNAKPATSYSHAGAFIFLDGKITLMNVNGQYVLDLASAGCTIIPSNGCLIAYTTYGEDPGESEHNTFKYAYKRGETLHSCEFVPTTWLGTVLINTNPVALAFSTTKTFSDMFINNIA